MIYTKKSEVIAFTFYCDSKTDKNIKNFQAI